MLKPETVELVVLLVFGPAIGACLCLRTSAAEWLTNLAAKPFRFLDGPDSYQPARLVVVPSQSLELEA